MSIKRNVILNTLYQLLNIIVPIVTTPYLARTVGADGIGTYAYHNAIAYYFILFIMLGLNNYGNRQIAKVRNDREKLDETFSNIYALQFLLGWIGTGIYVILTLVGKTDARHIALLFCLYVFSATFDITWFFSGLEEFQIIVTRNTIIKLISIVAILGLVKSKEDLWVYVLITSLSNIISQVSVWPFLKSRVSFVRPQWNLVKQHIKPNLILFVPVVAVSLYKIMDKIMLGRMTTSVQVGYYENAEKIINIPQALIGALGTVMLPRISNLLVNGKEELSKKYIKFSMQYSNCLSCGVVFGLIAISNNLAPWFFGEEFVICGNLIALLAPTVLFNIWASVIRTQYLIPKDKEKSYIISVFSGAVVNLIINWILIPKYQVYGVVIGTIVAEFVVMLMQTLAVRKELKIDNYIKDMIPFLVSGFCMLMIVKKVGNIDINMTGKIVLQIGVGIVSYFLISFAIYCFYEKKTVDELVKNILPNKKI